jgi:hypothetical protein
MLINIGIIVLLGAIAAAMIISVDRKVMKEHEPMFTGKYTKSFKTSKLKYTGGNN